MPGLSPTPLGLNHLDEDTGLAQLDDADVRAIGRALDRLEEAESELDRAIADARSAGDSWTAVAAVLGTSKQAAQPQVHARACRGLA